MEITGKVIQVLPLQGGTSATTGKSWQVETFILETLEQYPRKVAIEIFGEQRIKDNPVQIDGVYTASFDLESREFNGRWYTSARAWKVVPGNAQQAQQAPQQAQSAPQVATAPAPVAQPAAAPQPQQQSMFPPQGGSFEESTDLPF